MVLLEAGPDYVDPSALPADPRCADLPAFSHDWGYRDENGAELARARVVGGCSATNAAFALRGAPSDYDGWAAAVGGEWSFEAVLPWFRSIERDLDFGDRPAHGANGPLPITRIPRHRMPPAQQAFLTAAEARTSPPWPITMSRALSGLARCHATPSTVCAGALRERADHPLCGVVAAVSEMPQVGTPSMLTMVTARSQSWTGSAGPDLQVFLMAHPPGVDGQKVVTALVSVTRPVSRGRVALRSAEPLAPPRIDLAHLREDRDATRMAEGLTLARRIRHSPPLTSLASAEVTPATGGPSIADVVRAARAEVGTYHPVGTCRMGRPGDVTAVVGADGAVHGIDGLSVVDASVMPDIPSANTNLPTLMLADRLANRLRGPHPSPTAATSV